MGNSLMGISARIGLIWMGCLLAIGGAPPAVAGQATPAAIRVAGDGTHFELPGVYKDLDPTSEQQAGLLDAFVQASDRCQRLYRWVAPLCVLSGAYAVAPIGIARDRAGTLTLQLYGQVYCVSEKVGDLHDRNTIVLAEPQQIPVASDDSVRMCFDRTFEYAVVGWIFCYNIQR